MNFESGNLYHIYNQGNNRQQLFFSRDNYLFFLNKIKKHILPHADILAWCLMPNHFHLMVYVKDVIIANDALTHGVTPSRTPNSHYKDSLSQREAISKERTFNDSIGYLIRSYTQAINNQEKRTGSLFKAHTKAECLTNTQGITPSFFGSHINVRIDRKSTRLNSSH